MLKQPHKSSEKKPVEAACNAAGEPSLIGKDGKPKTAKQIAKEKAKAEKAAKFAAKQAKAKQQKQAAENKVGFVLLNCKYFGLFNEEIYNVFLNTDKKLISFKVTS